jgi:hypothetical protein
MSAEDTCAAIHALLEALPAFRDPVDVTVSDGIYFFYEDGETSPHGVAGRIVRVGNHPRSSGTLRRRLFQHYSGYKNGSVFRKSLGGALLRARDPDHPCLAPGPGRGHWELQDARPCAQCGPLEQAVSVLLQSRFRFRCVAIEDRSERNRFERLIIATIAQCPICRASPKWLGRYAYAETMRISSLWNSQSVMGPLLERADLKVFSQYVGHSYADGDVR